MSIQNEVLTVTRLLRPFNCAFRKVRIGSLGDGGYILPDDLSNISSLLSIGIGSEVSFDLHFAQHGLPIFQYDQTVEAPPIQHPKFQFHKIAWASNDSESSRSLESMNKTHGLNQTHDAILKFDTEGAEWETIPHIRLDTLKSFRIIVCELHGMTSIANEQFRKVVEKTLRILTNSHTVIHLHANNCCGISVVEGVPIPAVVELTLLRNDRSEFTPSFDPIPGPLDFPNMIELPDLILNPYA
jgi:hypothetical protein